MEPGFLAGAGHELEQHGVLLSVYYPGSALFPLRVGKMILSSAKVLEEGVG